MEFSMTLKGRTSRTLLYATFLVFDLSLLAQLISFSPTGILHTRPVRRARIALPVTVAETAPDFVQSVYVDNTLALDVVQQPEGDTNYVSPNSGEVTQFSTVTQYGNVGLLAHNYLSGREFSHLAIGQEVHLVYISGRVEHFIITEILRYQALEPKSPYSSFQDMNNTDEIVSVGEVFDRAYQGDYHLTFQTCIAKDGVSSWGRLFVIAVPKPEQQGLDLQNTQGYAGSSYSVK
jgi:hypothetical protein